MAEENQSRDFLEFQMINEKIIEIANSSIKTLVLINGAAAVSLLTFISSQLNSTNYNSNLITLATEPLTMFALGVFFACLGMLFSYLTHYATLVRINKRKGEDKGACIWRWVKRVVHLVSAVAISGSLASFLLGIVQFRDAITVVFY
ncbi:hypothetical protein [Neptunicoccus cionae]|uniref:hypothetical protein n=1 Tax=Neptunicoccus cionae TaxID=2035344 RepID=UPI0016637E2B|nr:hypothetical protein [Amylibacter cionae]